MVLSLQNSLPALEVLIIDKRVFFNEALVIIRRFYMIMIKFIINNHYNEQVN